ncbi:uncharacterized protein LOC104891112 [Beta vulgaris subsp. vulgaris]|uniref:uncharacterized protein LOC104891112 n=1 Tax=Beta vulgaris subsp. vulgaris TaxID=3555 RepID=UPI00053F5ABA|nr:uncharacterized protein LOC104891112 [Beta vulgaris subsp. vulgaris]
MEERLPNFYVPSSPISIMIWNVQGAGSNSFAASLKELVRLHRPEVLALVETHMGGDRAQQIASILKYSGHTRVDARGFSGGIWIYWHTENVTIDPIRQHDQYITMDIKKCDEQPWYFTAVYASPDPTRRHDLWRELKDFAAQNNKPWLIAGDFNETRFPSERNTSCSETTRRSARFNDWVDEMDLLEIEFVGASYTWSRGLSLETRQCARLDRAFCNPDWGLQFSQARVKHLPAIASDHCPLLISPNGFVPLPSLNKPFRFQAMWLHHEKFQEFVQSKWKHSVPIMSSLLSLSEALQDWNRDVFKNIFQRKRLLLARIEGVQKNIGFSTHRGLIKLESKLRRELEDVLQEEETYWFQKSRITWLKDGDRNTRFFHLSTIVRNWRNKISAIKDDDGIWLHDKDLVKTQIVTYFSTLFTEEPDDGIYDLPCDIFSRFIAG